MFTFGLFNRDKRAQKAKIRAVYDHLVEQARKPVFYESYGVEDTLSGRFDMIVLHAFLFFQRLKAEDEAAKDFGQEVFDTFFDDMDGSLRELGVGYQAVPKRIKKMGEAFYGRLSVYDSALESAMNEGNLEPLAQALHRNIFPNQDIPHEVADCLAHYMHACALHLKACDLGALYGADFSWPDPVQFLNNAAMEGKVNA